jgi:hypothetical protein
MRFQHLYASLALIAAFGRIEGQSSSILLTPPASLAVSTATAGSQPTGQSDNTARYSVTVASGRKKITAELDAPLPTGVTLMICLSAPSGAVSVGSVALGTSARDVVRYISVGQYSGLPVTITLTASVLAGVVPYNASHVVLTLVDDP